MKREETFVFAVNIRTPIINQNQEISECLGTGFFINTDNKYYLVTANHVAITTNNASYIVLSDNNRNPANVKLSSLNKSINWIHHQFADISALEIDAVNNAWISTRAFPYTLCDIGLKRVNRDIMLTIVGFPINLGIHGKFSPITFRSFAASDVICLGRFDTHVNQNMILLENPSIGGYSGGPVFDLATLVSGNLIQNTGNPNIIGLVHGTIGVMAAITPISYLKDII